MTRSGPLALCAAIGKLSVIFSGASTVTLSPKSFSNFFPIASRAWPRSASIQIKSSPLVQANRSTGIRNRANSKPAGFRSAAQVEFVVIIGDEGLHPVTKAARFQSFRNFVPKHAFCPLLLGEIRKSCGTRSWSASGGRGTLSYHALDDRHEGGVKPNAMEAVRFSRVVAPLLVSTLHPRSAPRAFALRDQRGDPCVLRNADRNRRTVRSVSTEPQRPCPSCGNELSGGMEFCPVCILRKAIAGGVESGESSSSEDAIKPTAQRFEHYELVTGADGTPVELGRGAMGSLTKRSTGSALSRDTESHQRAIS